MLSDETKSKLISQKELIQDVINLINESISINDLKNHLINIQTIIDKDLARVSKRLLL